MTDITAHIRTEMKVLRWRLLCAIFLLAGCVSQPPPSPPPPLSPPAPPAAPVKPKSYFKEGASQEEFERTKARCLIQKNAAVADAIGTNNMFALRTAQRVFPLCMRAEGWVLREER